MGIMSTSAGWYAQPEGQKSYWDGRQWTHRWVNGAAVSLPVATTAPRAPGSPSAVYADDALKAARSAAQRATWVGLAILVVGIIITWGSYSAANPGGGFVVAWGAVVFGGYRLIKGLYYLDDPTRLLK